jgi:hypothetical protein
MIFLLRLLPYARYIAAFFAMLGAILAIRHAGVVSEQKRQADIAIAGVKKHDKIETKVLSLDDIDLDKRLRRWYRD